MIMLRCLGAALVILAAGRMQAQSGVAQPGAAQPLWETLMQKPIPEDAVPKLSVFSFPPIPAAPAIQPAPGPGHMHAGPVFGYILKGEIENLVEPDPPGIYKAGEVFYETPMHLHRYLRNASHTEPASLIVFQAGDAGKAAPVIKLLMELPFAKAANQEVSLLRLTLAEGTRAEASGQSGPGIVYVLEGKIEAAGGTYKAGDLFVEQPGLTFRNVSDREPARLLLYQVSPH